MKMKNIFLLLLIVSSIGLFACSINEQAETITIDNYGEEIIYTPSAKDWCGENCIIYPENGGMYIRVQESGDNTFYPEGTDRISEEDVEAVDEAIENAIESSEQ